MSNIHKPIIEVSDGGASAVVWCTVCPSIRFQFPSYAAAGGREFAERSFGELHSDQYDEGRAPSIVVDWEPVGECSFCGRGSIVVDDDDGDGGVKCDFCGSFWDQDGAHGETDPEQLAELFDEAWDMAHLWAVAGRDSAGNIRMRSGAGTLVARAEDPRHAIEGWLSRARAGSEYWIQYRAALDLLDREAAAK